MFTIKQVRNFPFKMNRFGVILFASAALVTSACSGPSTEVESGEVSSVEDAQENVTTEEISDEFAQYEGQKVSVRQDVEEVIGKNSFTLDEDQFFGGEELLVIDMTVAGLELIEGEGTEVQVTGELTQFSLDELELGMGIELEPELFADYEGQPVILAESIALSPDPGDVTSDPEAFYDRRIVVEGEVEAIYGSDILTLEDEALFGGEPLLVLNPGGVAGVIATQEGETVAIVGTLRPVVLAEIEQEYDLTWDLDLQPELEAELEGKPAFIADEVYPSAM
ncbi:MAG: hypothetical protein AAFW75_24310 [Cyanobacteria bacterium J06636_16]